MDQELLKQLTLGVLPPGVFGVALFLAAFFTARRGTSPAIWRTAAVALGVGLGYALLTIPVFGTPVFPPARAFDQLPIAAALGAISGLLSAAAFTGGPLAPWAVRLPIIALAGVLVLGREASAAPLELGQLALLAGFTAVVAFTLAASDRLHTRRPGPASQFASMAQVGLIAQLLVIAFASLKLGQAVGIVASMLGAAWLVSYLRPVSLARGGADAPVILAFAALLQGSVLGQGPAWGWAFGLLAAAVPVMPLLAGIAPLSRLAGWKHALLRAALALIPAGVAMALALATSTPPEY